MAVLMVMEGVAMAMAMEALKNLDKNLNKRRLPMQDGIIRL